MKNPNWKLNEYPKDFDFEAAYCKLWEDFCRLHDFCWDETYRAQAAETKLQRLVDAEVTCEGEC